MKPLVYDSGFLDFSKMYGHESWLEALRIDRSHLTAALQRNLPEHLNDLLDVAMAVYAADRICRRSPGKRRDKEDLVQGRILRLRVPVRNPELWSQEALKNKLVAALESLTYDEWDFDFCPVRVNTNDTYRIKLFKEQLVSPFVGLFSGGLDSLAGAALQSSQNPGATGILVVATTNSRLIRVQGKLVRELNEKTSGRFLPVIIPHQLDSITNELFSERRQEKSQRTRGFLYPALGAVAAVLAGTDTLHVYENGVGAINLPYTHATIGADHARSMHPTNLLLMGEFLSELFGSPFDIRNTSTWQTKGKMCAALNNMGLGELALETVSCDGFPLRYHPPQCGRCTSCLLRRVSLFSGSLSEFEQQKRYYKYDILSMPAVGYERHLYPLRFMLAQVERLRHAVESGQPMALLLREFPELYEVRSSLAKLENQSIQEVDDNLVELYREYVKEWNLFSCRLPSVFQFA